jgi:hypothetical protein
MSGADDRVNIAARDTLSAGTLCHAEADCTITAMEKELIISIIRAAISSSSSSSGSRSSSSSKINKLFVCGCIGQFFLLLLEKLLENFSLEINLLMRDLPVLNRIRYARQCEFLI